eukprot:scaffold126206_cov17-Prasinocladus_malaysianus.AAC.1
MTSLALSPPKRCGPVYEEWGKLNIASATYCGLAGSWYGAQWMTPQVCRNCSVGLLSVDMGGMAPQDEDDAASAPSRRARGLCQQPGRQRPVVVKVPLVFWFSLAQA